MNHFPDRDSVPDMKRDDFHIGVEFTCGDGTFRCTDVGTRTVVAIRIDEVSVASVNEDGSVIGRTIGEGAAKADGWFDGPPYAVAETVFDEDDLEACEPITMDIVPFS